MHLADNDSWPAELHALHLIFVPNAKPRMPRLLIEETTSDLCQTTPQLFTVIECQCKGIP